MRETGIVTEIKGKTAVVSVDKKEECSRCGLCLFKEGANKTEFYVKNESGVKVGDNVTIESSENGKFIGVILVFFVPLLLIGLAVLMNYLFIKKEIWILILSVSFIAVWFILLALLDKKFKEIGLFNARIISVLPAPEKTVEDDIDAQTTKE